MGKRSKFERREADFYPTPYPAVLPLIPFLRRESVKTFAEPCAGAGDLVRVLGSFGFHCVYAGDIRTGQDAFAIGSYGNADAIITNPPWSRDVLHPLIDHLKNIAPVRPHHVTIGSLTAARRHYEFTPRLARPTNRSCLRISVAGTAHQLHDRSRAVLQWAEPRDAALYGSQSLGRALQGGSHARPVNLL